MHVPVTITIPAEGNPLIGFQNGAFPGRRMFAVVIPPGGSEETARLFCLSTPAAAKPVVDMAPFHEGPRPAAGPITSWVLEPNDSDAVPRLFERGCHPGDFEIIGGKFDQFRRPEKAVLAFFDLSDGMKGFDRLSTPTETRYGLAEACARLDGAEWQAAANLFDPAGLMREGVIEPLGGNPMTQENFHGYMMEMQAKANAGMDVVNHPMKDFRLFETSELAAEMIADSRAVLYGAHTMDRKHPAYTLLKDMLPDFASAFSDDETGAESLLSEARAAYVSAVAQAESDLSVYNLCSGIGPGAVCWRNLFGIGGLLDTSAARLASPGCDDHVLSQFRELPGDIQEAFRDPAVILLRRPRTIMEVSRRCEETRCSYLPLHARRMAAAPGLQLEMMQISDARIEDVFAGTDALIRAFDEIANSNTAAAEARDALAVGWRVLGAEMAGRGLRDSDALIASQPSFLDPGVDALPYLRDLIAARVPELAVRFG